MAGRAGLFVIPSAARNLQLIVLGAILALTDARAQNATVAGEVLLREGGVPLGYITVSVLAQDKHLLTDERGTFFLREVPPGEVRLRFRRIGFAPKDTTFTLAAGDTARIRIAMTRLAIQLPEVVVSGRCTNETPFEPKPAFMAELFDQVMQNAQRLKMLAAARPFVIQTIMDIAHRNPDGTLEQFSGDTAVRGALPVVRYEPRRVVRRAMMGGKPVWGVYVPELPDFADTAFTNNHCFRYAGQTRLESDSVIAVDFEPVPWLDKEVDIKGTMYLRADGYQLVAVVARLNRLHREGRHIREYTHRTRFREIEPGIPALAEWELVNVFRNTSARPVVGIGRVVDIRWDSTVKTDTMQPHR